MDTVLLVVHLMIAIALVGVVLLQRSEGGALGMGGGGGGFITGRGAANLLTRTTALLAAAFFVTSISLTILGRQSGPSPLGTLGGKPAATAPATGPGTETTGDKAGAVPLEPIVPGAPSTSTPPVLGAPSAPPASGAAPSGTTPPASGSTTP